MTTAGDLLEPEEDDDRMRLCHDCGWEFDPAYNLCPECGSDFWDPIPSPYRP